MKRGVSPLALSLVLTFGCAPPAPPPGATHPATAPGTPALGVTLVESWPLETKLDHADVPDAKDVWLEMIDHARTSIDLAEFYLSDDPAATSDHPSPLGKVVASIERAAARGVVVRVLVDDAFYPKYPELPSRLAKTKGVTVRRIDGKAYGGGILHAKYFVVDGRDAYVGSQNFDYRSLSHIHELGVRSDDTGVVSGLRATFDRDFRVAGGEAPSPIVVSAPSSSRVVFGASPESALPAGVAWDLPAIVHDIRAAKREVLVQVLGYKAAFRDGSPFLTLDHELRAAAARGVSVTIQVGAWHGKEPSLLALASAGVHVRVLEVPKYSGGEIPFARVIHAKYMVIDRERAWVGTSNWEGDYFHKSRNVSVFVDDRVFAERLAGIFADVAKELPAAAPAAAGVRGLVAP